MKCSTKRDRPILAYQIRFTKVARDDLKRLYSFLLVQDVQVASNALAAIHKAVELLATFPFTCRKAQADNPFLRELIISFGANGYVALFEIEENNIVTILAVRHQREDDYR
jgi:plasmid stabilization system protein ParE